MKAERPERKGTGHSAPKPELMRVTCRYWDCDQGILQALHFSY